MANGYSAVNARELKRCVEREMMVDDTVYINIIGFTEKAVTLLRGYITAGILKPIEEEVEKVYKDVEAVMSGETIFPQMTYRKEKAINNE